MNVAKRCGPGHLDLVFGHDSAFDRARGTPLDEGGQATASTGVFGYPVNEASRLCSACETEGILVTELVASSAKRAGTTQLEHEANEALEVR